MCVGWASHKHPTSTPQVPRKYPVSLEKLKRIRQRLAENGFTRFAEA